MSHLTSHHTLPPFAQGLRTAPLVSISLAKLESASPVESETFFDACKNLGFFYLDMNASQLGERMVSEAEELNVLQKEFFELSNAVKEEYGREKLHQFYAYRYEEFAERDVNMRNESYNLRKDDVLGNRERLACHPMILAHQPLFEKYTRHCRTVIDLMLSLLNSQLQLPPNTLASLHRLTSHSGDHVRFTQNPPTTFDPDRAARGEHTDFGSITILFNWLGGLQIRTPDTNEWVYVRPIPGSCVVNLGDAMVKFTAGILKSNVHRVVPPMGKQATVTRNSLVYFSRPEDDVVLRRLKGGLIDEVKVAEREEEEMTSEDWVMRRSHGDLHGVYTVKGLERRKQDMMSRPVAVDVK